MPSPISEPSPPLRVRIKKAGLQAQLGRDLLHVHADRHWSPEGCRGWERAHLNSLLPPGNQAENQMVRCETLINNNMNAYSVQKASHQQISACLLWSSVSEKLPVITLQLNESPESQAQIGTTCVSWVAQTPSSLQMRNYGVRSPGRLDANSESGLGPDWDVTVHTAIAWSTRVTPGTASCKVSLPCQTPGFCPACSGRTCPAISLPVLHPPFAAMLPAMFIVSLGTEVGEMTFLLREQALLGSVRCFWTASPSHSG